MPWLKKFPAIFSGRAKEGGRMKSYYQYDGQPRRFYEPKDHLERSKAFAAAFHDMTSGVAVAPVSRRRTYQYVAAGQPLIAVAAAGRGARKRLTAEQRKKRQRYGRAQVLKSLERSMARTRAQAGLEPEPGSRGAALRAARLQLAAQEAAVLPGLV